MTTSLTGVSVQGYDTSNPGDPIAAVEFGALTFQAGSTALWNFVDDVAALIAQAQNVDNVVVTKYETVTTVV